MSNLQMCKACGGVYFDPQPDGSAYFHACPPIPNEAYQPDPTQPHYDPRGFVPRPDHRDENVRRGLQVRDGKYVLVDRDPNDAQRERTTPVADAAKIWGAGREAVKP